MISSNILFIVLFTIIYVGTILGHDIISTTPQYNPESALDPSFNFSPSSSHTNHTTEFPSPTLQYTNPTDAPFTNVALVSSRYVKDLDIKMLYLTFSLKFTYSLQYRNPLSLRFSLTETNAKLAKIDSDAPEEQNALLLSIQPNYMASSSVTYNDFLSAMVPNHHVLPLFADETAHRVITAPALRMDQGLFELVRNETKWTDLQLQDIAHFLTISVPLSGPMWDIEPVLPLQYKLELGMEFPSSNNYFEPSFENDFFHEEKLNQKNWGDEKKQKSQKNENEKNEKKSGPAGCHHSSSSSRNIKMHQLQNVITEADVYVTQHNNNMGTHQHHQQHKHKNDQNNDKKNNDKNDEKNNNKNDEKNTTVKKDEKKIPNVDNSMFESSVPSTSQVISEPFIDKYAGVALRTLAMELNSSNNNINVDIYNSQSTNIIPDIRSLSAEVGYLSTFGSIYGKNPLETRCFAHLIDVNACQRPKADPDLCSNQRIINDQYGFKTNTAMTTQYQYVTAVLSGKDAFPQENFISCGFGPDFVDPIFMDWRQDINNILKYDTKNIPSGSERKLTDFNVGLNFDREMVTKNGQKNSKNGQKNSKNGQKNNWVEILSQKSFFVEIDSYLLQILPTNIIDTIDTLSNQLALLSPSVWFGNDATLSDHNNNDDDDTTSHDNNNNNPSTPTNPLTPSSQFNILSTQEKVIQRGYHTDWNYWNKHNGPHKLPSYRTYRLYSNNPPTAAGLLGQYAFKEELPKHKDNGTNVVAIVVPIIVILLLIIVIIGIAYMLKLACFKLKNVKNDDDQQNEMGINTGPNDNNTSNNNNTSGPVIEVSEQEMTSQDRFKRSNESSNHDEDEPSPVVLV